jgi:hypothetical protein
MCFTKQFIRINVVLFICLIVFGSVRDKHAAADTQTLIFSTWVGFEVDKCASIWLIKRFVDKAAIIQFYPKGELIDKGIPFDTPDAKFRRYHNMSTYESIVKYYKLKDPKVVYIGKIIHDIEVNVWERKQMKETHMVQREVNQIILNSSDNEDVIEKSIKFFDRLYKNRPTE